MVKSEKNLSQDSDLKEKEAKKVSDSKKEESTEEKLEKTQEKLLRSMAEVENQRRRFEKEKEEAFEFGGFNFARESLSLLDNIDRATDSFRNDEKLKNNKDLEKIIDGIEVVKNDLISIFKKNGIIAIDCKNKKFDPNFHQAMVEIEDDNVEIGTIVQEIQPGYMFGDRLLRPSMVAVSKKKDLKNKDKNEKK